MKKRLVVVMLLVGMFSIKAMEVIDDPEEDCETTHKTTYKTKHRTKTKRRQKVVHEWGNLLGFENDYSDQSFQMSINSKGKRNIRIQCTGDLKIPLQDEEFLDRFLNWLPRIDPRNMDKGRAKAFAKILKMPTTPEAKLTTVYAQKLYQQNEMPPWILMFTYMEIISGRKETLIDSDNKRARRRYKLERRSSKANLQSNRNLQKAIEKVRDSKQ